jgi:hypothetical protein
MKTIARFALALGLFTAAAYQNSQVKAADFPPPTCRPCPPVAVTLN